MSASRVNKTGDSLREGNESKAAAYTGKTLPAVPVPQAKAIQPAKSTEPPVQKKDRSIDMERFPGLESMPDSPSKLALAKELTEKGVSPENADSNKTKALIIEAKAQEAHKLIEEAINKSEDTIVLAAALENIKTELGLLAIEMAELGTSKAAVKFQVNPWYTHVISPGKVIWRMVGTHSTAITQVDWKSESLTIGSETALVGKQMIAAPLAPDHEPGSLSSVDTEQTKMMHQLANAGNTGVPNASKYIKGHLLNDHVGGPGESLNLFPITADANAKHLAYVEKFIKAQLAGNYVLHYQIDVEHKTPAVKTGKNYIDSAFNFFWQLLDTSAKPFLTAHKDEIQSIYEEAGDSPFDNSVEYSGLFDKLHSGKGTPNVIPQPGQWQEPSISSPGMTSSKISPTLSAFSIHSGFLGGGGGSSSTSSSPPPADCTGYHIKQDSTGLNFVSTRKLPTGLKPGDPIQVQTGTVAVADIKEIGGGWIRIYFK